MEHAPTNTQDSRRLDKEASPSSTQLIDNVFVFWKKVACLNRGRKTVLDSIETTECAINTTASILEEVDKLLIDIARIYHQILSTNFMAISKENYFYPSFPLLPFFPS